MLEQYQNVLDDFHRSFEKERKYKKYEYIIPRLVMVQ